MLECPSCKFEFEAPEISDKSNSSGTVNNTLIHVSCRKCKYHFLVKPSVSIAKDSAGPVVSMPSEIEKETKMTVCPNCEFEVKIPDQRGVRKTPGIASKVCISCPKCKYNFSVERSDSIAEESVYTVVTNETIKDFEAEPAVCPNCIRKVDFPETRPEVPEIFSKEDQKRWLLTCGLCKYMFFAERRAKGNVVYVNKRSDEDAQRTVDAEATRPVDTGVAKKSYLRDAISAFDKFVGEISEAERSETMIEIMKASSAGKPIVEKYIKLASTVDWLVSEGFHVQITGRIENKDPWTAGGLPSEAKISGWGHETMPKIKSVIYPSPESYKKLEAAWSKKYGIGGENKISPDAVARMIAELELKEFEVFSRIDGTIDVRKALEGRVDSNMDGFIIRYEERKMYHFNGGYYLETSEK